MESALAGFEMTKYVPPVVRLEEDEDYEDIEDLQKETSESEVDVFAQFFSSQGWLIKDYFPYFAMESYELRPEKTGFLHMRKQRRRSASRLPRS